MKEEFKKEVTAAINEWLDKENPLRTQAALQQKAGVSASEVSLITRGIYANNGYAIKEGSFYKLANALGVKSEEASIHWDTKNFTRIQSVCEAFKLRKKIGLFDSTDSGVGKTYGLEYFATINDQIAYIKITHTMGAKDLLKELASKVCGDKILDTTKGVRSLLDSVRKRVLSQPGYLLIFDEMEYAKSSLHNIIKEIIDFTYGHCGVIVCGLGLRAKIEKFVLKGKAGFAQLKRRLFTNIIELRPLQNSEKAEILKLHKITNVKAVAWFNRNVEDFQMLSEYIKDLIRWMEANPDKEVNEMILDQLFKAY